MTSYSHVGLNGARLQRLGEMLMPPLTRSSLSRQLFNGLVTKGLMLSRGISRGRLQCVCCVNCKSGLVVQIDTASHRGLSGEFILFSFCILLLPGLDAGVTKVWQALLLLHLPKPRFLARVATFQALLGKPVALEGRF